MFGPDSRLVWFLNPQAPFNFRCQQTSVFKLMKIYRVLLKNGSEFKIKAESYRFTDDRYAVQFYRSPHEVIPDVFVYAGEVAAILPDKQTKAEPGDDAARN